MFLLTISQSYLMHDALDLKFNIHAVTARKEAQIFY
jgi:hypothetical protein